MIGIKEVFHDRGMVVVFTDEEGDMLGHVPVVNARTVIDAVDAALAYVQEGYRPHLHATDTDIVLHELSRHYPIVVVTRGVR